MILNQNVTSIDDIIQEKFRVTGEQFIQELVDLVGSIKDPQCSATLNQLNIIKESSIRLQKINSQPNIVFPLKLIVIIKPTVPHCHLTQQIGLSIHYKLKNELPESWYKMLKIRIICEQGSHNQKQQVQKLMNDKQRIAAAWQNQEVMSLIKRLCQ